MNFYMYAAFTTLYYLCYLSSYVFVCYTQLVERRTVARAGQTMRHVFDRWFHLVALSRVKMGKACALLLL